MNTYVIIHLSNLSLNTYYQADEPTYSIFGGENGSPQASAHLPVPEGLSWDVVKGQREEDGSVTVVADPTKVAAKTEAAWSDLRIKRNALLVACDWTQLADTRMSQDRKDAWTQYRQELRDFPDSVSDPTQVTWPSAPGSQ